MTERINCTAELEKSTLQELGVCFWNVHRSLGEIKRRLELLDNPEANAMFKVLDSVVTSGMLDLRLHLKVDYSLEEIPNSLHHWDELDARDPDRQ